MLRSSRKLYSKAGNKPSESPQDAGTYSNNIIL